MGDTSFTLAVSWGDSAHRLAVDAHERALSALNEADATYPWEVRERRRLRAIAGSWLERSMEHSQLALWWSEMAKAAATTALISRTKHSLGLMLGEVASLGVLDEFSTLMDDLGEEFTALDTEGVHHAD